MTLDEFLPLLSGVRRCSSGHMAMCPAHNDRQQSLHVAANGHGLGLKCHAGCSNESILAVMNLSWDDLFTEEQPRQDQRIIATYDYTDEKGQLLYQSLRYQPKTFKQRRPDGNGGWVWNMQGVKRVPYMLPEILATDAPIFIVEGEKDVHTLRVHGFVATTNVGGAGKWLKEWSPLFAMQRVILIPDMDKPGFEHANQVGTYLRDVADVRYIRLRGAKDITDWFLFHTVDEFNLMVEGAKDYEGPISLNEVTVKPYSWIKGPTDYGLLGEIVELIIPHSEADPLALYMELLVIFGNCVGPGPHFRVGGTYHRCNMFLAICGETASGRKGTAHDWAVEVFRQVDPIYTVQALVGGLTSGEGLVHTVRNPRLRVLKDGSTTVTDEGVTDKRRVFTETELAGRTFTAMRRDGSTLSAVLRQAWESTTLAVATKINDNKATGAHVSLIGHATVAELLMTLRHADIVGGFANRFLFFVVRRSKLLPIQTLPESRSLTALAYRVLHVLQEARKVTEVTFAPEALNLWIKIYNDLDADAQNDDLNVAPFLSRAAPQILRMAMILTLIDGRSTIGLSQLTAANGLWACARQSVEFMLDNGMTTLSVDQQKLFNLLEAAGGPMTCTEARTALKWNGARFAIVKGELLKLKVISETLDKSTGGRPAQRIWVIE